MPISPRKLLESIPFRFRRIVISGVILFCAGMLLLLSFFALLPSIISTHPISSRLQENLSDALKRQVSWSSLTVSWTNGIVGSGVLLGPGAPPLVSARVGDISIRPHLAWQAGRPRLDVTLVVTGLAAELAPGPPKAPAPPREPLSALADAVQRFQALDFPLPFDLGVQLNLSPAKVDYNDRKTGRCWQMQNLELKLDIPSLADKPVTAALTGDISLDGRPLSTLALSATLQQLVTPARRIQPATAVIELKGNVPGAVIAIKGGLQEADGLTATVQLSLPELLAVAAPLLPPAVPDMRGTAAVRLMARFDAERNLHADLDVAGRSMAVNSARLRSGVLAPLDIRLRQKLLSDRRREQVRFIDGEITVSDLLQASWRATIDRPSRRDRVLSAEAGPLIVDLQRLAAVAAPLVPKTAPVRKLTGKLTLQRLTAWIQGRTRQGELTVSGLAADIPSIDLTAAGRTIAANNLYLSVDTADVHLTPGRTVSCSAVMTHRVGRCDVKGPQHLALSGLNGSLRLGATDLRTAPASPRKIAATISLQQQLSAGYISVRDRMSLDRLSEQFTATAALQESGALEVTRPDVMLSASAMQVAAGVKIVQPFPVTIRLQGERISLPAHGGGMRLDSGSCAVESGSAVRMSARFALSGESPQRCRTTGAARVDLEQLLPVVRPFLPDGADAAGNAELAWDCAAPLLPLPLKSGAPLARVKALLELPERGLVTLAVNGRDISWPLAHGILKTDALRTAQPLRLELPAGKGGIAFDGALLFTGVNGLPGVRGTPQLSGDCSFRGSLHEWQQLRLTEALRITSLGIEQKGDVTFNRLDRLLDRPKPFALSLLLQAVDATATADIALHSGPASPNLPGGVKLTGDSRVGIRLNLAGGKELKVNASAAAHNLDVYLKSGTTLEGVNADFALDRVYALGQRTASGWTPLTVSLLRPLPAVSKNTGASELVGRIRDDLRGQERGSRKFTIRRIVTGGMRRPITFTSVESDLLLSAEEAGITFFQADAAGGTIRMRSLCDLKPAVPVLSLACSFSNLESHLLLPGEAGRTPLQSGQDTRLTGEMSLDAPFLTDQRELLEGVRMSLNLRRIGADTIERALFSLDPYERNEKLVAQRKLLRNGRLNGLRATAHNGAFSLEGDVQVKGVAMPLPGVERIRLSELSIRKQMEKTVAGITAARRLANLLRADMLVIRDNGTVSLVRRGDE